MHNKDPCVHIIIYFVAYYGFASPISSLQIFGSLLDVATLLWLYATERKCCDELAMNSSLTMALCKAGNGVVQPGNQQYAFA